MKKTLFATAFALLIALNCFSLSAADASYKHWRNAMKAAEQARYQRDFEKMRTILEGSAAEAQQHGPLSSAENAWWLTVAYERLQLHDEAIKTFDKELERIGPNPTALKLQIIRGILLNERGATLYRMGKYDAAMSSVLEAKRVLESAGGKFHPELFYVYTTLGQIQALQKNFAEAENSMRTALKLAQSRESHTQSEWTGAEQQTILYSRDPQPYRIIFAATDLGQLLQIEGKFDEAHDAFETAVKNAKATYPKESVMRLLPLRGLAEVDFKLGRRKDFEKGVEQVYEIVSKTPGLEQISINPLWLKLYSDLDDQNAAHVSETTKKIAKVFDLQNFQFSYFGERGMSNAIVNGSVDWKRAAALQKAFIETAESYRATEPMKAGMIYVAIAKFAAVNGKTELAEAMFEQAVKSQANAKDKALVIGVLGRLAEDKIAAGKKAEALPLYQQVTAAMREKYGNDMRVADAMDTQAVLMKELGQEQAALDLQAQAMDVRKKSIGK